LTERLLLVDSAIDCFERFPLYDRSWPISAGEAKLI
jgi:hypothetical protein